MFCKIVDGKRKIAPKFIHKDGKIQVPTSEWYKQNGYVDMLDDHSSLMLANNNEDRAFSFDDLPIYTNEDTEKIILENIYKKINSIVIQRTEQYKSNDVSLIQCFWGKDQDRIKATIQALQTNAEFTFPKEWIFVEAQTKRRNAKFEQLAKDLNLKYIFIKMRKQQEDLFLKTALWNIGYSKSSCSKLAFLDSDIVFCKQDWLKSVSKDLEENDVISLHSRCYYAKQAFDSNDNSLDSFKTMNFSRGFTLKNHMNVPGHSGFSIGMTRQFFDNYFKFFDVIPGKYEDLLYWYKATGEKIEKTPYQTTFRYTKPKPDLKVGYGEAICCHIGHGQISERGYEKQISLKNFIYDPKSLRLPYFAKESFSSKAIEYVKSKFLRNETHIDWSIFDKIYCIHYVQYEERLDQIKKELRYLGILDLPQFEFYYTSPNDFYNKLLKDSTDQHQETVYIGNVNLQMNRLNLFQRIKFLKLQRVLILEDDIIFNNDKNYIKDCIENFPLDYDIVNMDPYVVNSLNVVKEVNHYYSELKNIMYNCSCISFTSKAIDNFVQEINDNKTLIPGDNIYKYIHPDVKMCVCNKNICVQSEFENRQNLFLDTSSKYTSLNLFEYKKKNTNAQERKPEIRFEIDITRECNWKCNSCNRLCNLKPINPGSIMTLNEVKNVIKQIKKASKSYRISKLKILGGEPTLHNQFKEICQLIKDQLFDVIQNHNICIGTNGSNNSKFKSFIENEMKFKIIGDNKTLISKNIDHRNTWLSPHENGQKLVELPCWIQHECGVAAFKVDGEVRWYWCNVGSIVSMLLNQNINLKKTLQQLLKTKKEDMYEVCKHCQCAAFNPVKFSDNSNVSEIFKENLSKYLKD